MIKYKAMTCNQWRLGLHLPLQSAFSHLSVMTWFRLWAITWIIYTSLKYKAMRIQHYHYSIQVILTYIPCNSRRSIHTFHSHYSVVWGKPNHLLVHMISSNCRCVFSTSKLAIKGRQRSVLIGNEATRTNINILREPPTVDSFASVGSLYDFFL